MADENPTTPPPASHPLINRREADYWTMCAKCGARIAKADIMHAQFCPMKDSLDNLLEK